MKQRKRFKRRLLSILLSVALVLGLMPVNGWGQKVLAADTHNHSGWTAWSNQDSLPYDGAEGFNNGVGNFYLTTDVEVGTYWTGCSSGKTINICLNGHSIKLVKKEYSSGSIEISGTLNLYECSTTPHYITLDDNWTGTNISTTGTEGDKCVKVIGGAITGQTGSKTAISVDNGGTFNMHGGTIAGNYSGNNGVAGVKVYSGGTFNMYGGKITKNQSGNSCGGVYLDGSTNSGAGGATFTMTGGEIVKNMSTNNVQGGGLYSYGTNNTINFSGSPIIKDNICQSNSSNFYFKHSCTVNITGALTSSASIGVKTADGILTTSGWTEKMSSATPSNYFKTDSTYLVVKLREINGKNETVIGKRGNKYYLQQAIANATTLKNTCDSGGHTAISSQIATAITPAQAVCDDNDAFQDEIDEAKGALDNAREFASYKVTKKNYAESLRKDGDSSARTALITNAKTQIDELLYDTSILLVENKARVDAIIAQLESDLETLYNQEVIVGQVATAVNEISAKSNLVYSGSELALVNAPTSALPAGYSVKYAVSTENPASGTLVYSSTVPTKTNAGKYYVWCEAVDSSDAVVVQPICKEVTIGKKDVVVSGITANDKVYDRSDSAVLITNDASFDGLVNGDNLTVSATGTFENMNAGTGKVVTISNLVLGGNSVANYQIASSGNQSTTTAKITPKTLTVNAAAKSKTYGAADPEFTYTYEGLIDGDSVSGSLSRETGDNVGTYDITQGTLSAGDNYTISYTGAKLTIGKKTLDITADAKTKVYGEVDPELTFTCNGFENGDTANNVITGELGRTAGDDVGEYTIIQNTLSAGDNYAINYTENKLTINKKEIEIAWSNTELIYNGSDQLPTATASNLVGNDVCLVTVTGGKTNANTVDEPNYTATATSLSNNNYKLPENKTTTFTIAKKNVTVTANDQQVLLHNDIIQGTDKAVLSDALDEHTLTSITLTASSTDNTTTNGTITPSEAVIKNGETDVTANYNITYVDGTLTVTKGTPVVTAPTANDLTYNKQDQVLITAGSTTGGTIQYSLDREGWTDENADWTDNISDIKAQHAGNYKIHYRVAGNEDYYDVESADITATIKQKDIQISDIKVNNKTYDKTTDTTLNYDDVVYGGIETGDILTVTAVGTFVDENAGVGKTVDITGITLGGESINDYKLATTGQQTTATATINQKTVGLTWDTDTFTFDGHDHKPAATATELVDGDSCTVTVTGENTPAGSYTATASALSNDNYKLPNNPTQAFTIQPKEIKAEDVSMGHSEGLAEGHYAYIGESVTPNVIVSTVLVENEDATTLVNKTDYEMSRETSALAKGNHIIKFDFKGNYKGTVYKQWNIDPQTITVTAVNTEKTYGDDDPELTFTVSDDKVSLDDLVVNVGRTEGENVGTYDITVTGDEEQGDFIIEYVKGTFTINKATAVVKAVNKSKTYGDDDPDLTAKVTGLKRNDAESVIEYTLNRAGGNDAGSYTITPAGEAEQGNYAVTYQTGTFKINKKKLDASFVSLDKVSFADDGKDHSPKPVFEGYTLTEGIDYEVSGEATANDKGEHTITITGKGTNFTGSIDLKWYITSIGDNTVTYDGKSHTITYDEADGVTFLQADGISYGATPPSYKDAGSYDIEYMTTVDNPMFGYIPDVPEKLTINGKAALTIKPAEITVTAENKTKIYGQDDPEFTFTVEGLIDGETVDDVFTNKTLGRVKDDNDNVGEHDIVKGSLATNGNYVIKTFNKGTLTITKKPLDVSAFNIILKSASGTEVGALNGNEVPYGSDGFKVEATASEGTTGLGNITVKYYSVSDTNVETELTPAGTKPVNAGKYQIKLSVEAGDNYEGTGTDLFTNENWYFVITKAPFPENVPENNWPTGCTGLVYTGSEQVLMTAASETTGIPDGYTVKYSTDGTTWSAEIPKGTNAGDYKIYVKYAYDSNHSDSEVKEYTVTIEKKNNPEEALNAGDFDVSKASGENIADGVIAGFKADKSYEYSIDNGLTWTAVIAASTSVSEIKPGSVLIRYSGDSNTKPSDAITIVVGYKVDYDAPAENSITVTKTSGTDKSDGSVSGVADTMEYSTDNGVNWTSVSAGNTKLEGLGAGTIKIRKKGDADHNPSAPVTKEIGVKENQNAPSASDFNIVYESEENAKDGKINNVDDSMEYSIDDGQTWKSVAADKTSIEGLGAGDVKIRKKGDADHNPSEAITVTIGVKENQDAPNASTFTVTKTSGADKTDGVINGVDDSMEYSIDNGQTWTSGPSENTKIEGLGAGTVKIRYKETDTKRAGAETDVIVGTKSDQEAPSSETVKGHKTSGEDKSDGSITGVEDSMEYSTDGGNNWTSVTKDKTTIEGLGKGEVKIRKKGDADHNPSEAIVVTIGFKEDQAAPGAGTFTVTKTSGSDKTDGVIDGVDDSMEYSTDGGNNWTSVPKDKTKIEGLGAGEVKIRYKVTADKNVGAETTVTIGVKENQEAPSSETVKGHKTSGADKSDGSITGVEDSMEYSTDGGNNWISVQKDKTKIEGLGAGDVKIRKKGDADHNPSEAITVTIGFKEDQAAPNASTFTVTKTSGTDKTDGVIDGVEDSMEYSTDGGNNWTSVSKDKTKIEGLGAGEVKIRKKGDVDHNPSEAITVTIGVKEDQVAPNANTFTVTKTSGSDKTDGVIDGVDDSMEYSTDGGNNWTSVPKDKTAIEGLGVGEVKIRKKGDADHNPSEAIVVTIGFKEDQAAPGAGTFTVTKTSGTDKTDGVIDGVDDSMEYSTDGGNNWTSVPKDKTKIEGLGAGEVKIRYKGTADKNVGAETTVTIGVKGDQEAPSSETVKGHKTSGTDKTDGVIDGVDDSMEYSTDGGNNWTSVPKDKTAIEGLGAGDVKIRKKGDADHNPSEAIAVTIGSKGDQAAPGADTFTVTKTSGTDKTDGVINGVDDSMEYSTDGGQTWTSVPSGNTKIEGLGAGTVKVRYKGTSDKNAGEETEVIVGTKSDQNAPDKTKINVTNASGDDESDGIISGVDDTMEYSTDDGKTWTAVGKDKTSIDGLGVGDVLIRYCGDDDNNSSDTIKVTVGISSKTEGIVNFNKTEESEGTKPVETVVESAQSSNIEEYAETQVEEGKDIKVELEITPKNEEDVDEVSVNETKDVVEEVFAGIDKEKLVTEYLEIDLTKYVNNVKEDKKISDTKTPLEIALTYDKSKTSNPMVIRTHNNKACVFRKLSSRPTDNFVDATYYVAEGIIYIYSQFFSDFAIVYATENTYTVSIDTGVGDPIIQVVGEESKLNLPTDLKKDGFAFGGWFKDERYSSSWDVDNDKVNEDTRIYGKWDKSVTGVNVTSGNTVELKKVGETSQIKVSVTPDDAANTKVTYLSSDIKVATVDENGVVTAVGDGTATITISTEDGNKTATVKVTVAIAEVKPQGTSDKSTTDNTNSTEQDKSEEQTSIEQPVIEPTAKEKAELAMNAGLKISQTGSNINIKWGKVKEADGYKVYVTYCGMKFSKPVKVLDNNTKTSTKVTKINGKKINLKKNFKVYVAAYKAVDGNNETLAKSITGHIVGCKNTAYTNVKMIKLSKSSYTIKVGKTAKIKAKTVLVDKKKKQLSNAHASQFRYTSSNKNIATVSKNGKIKGISKGTCIIYVYARNGYAKKVSVTVK